MATNFLNKSTDAKNKELHLVRGILRIIHEKKLPRIVELMIEASPAFQADYMPERINAALKVINLCFLNKEYLWEALMSDKSVRMERFGVQWELPVRIAYGLICDLENGVDVFNPSAADIRSSELFAITVKEYIPDGISSGTFNNGYSAKLVEDLIARTELSPDRKPFTEWSEEQILANMHPKVAAICKQALESAGVGKSGILDYYETLSEVVKSFPDKDEWKEISWKERNSRVPELSYIGIRGSVQIEEDYLKL